MYISVLEKTNIDKMIELLHSVSLETYIDFDKQTKNWYVELKIIEDSPMTDQPLFLDNNNINLCDALWELVKSFALKESEVK
jgi:hypothetical protein